MTVRVLIVDDSLIFATAICEMLNGDAEIRVVGAATNGSDAVAAVERHKPDLVIMDLSMPGMGGLDAVELIMARRPTPILVMTGDGRADRERLAMEAIRRGALDLMLKPESYPASDPDARQLCDNVKLLASVAVVRHQRASVKAVAAGGRDAVAARARVIGIVGSTGGPAALATVLAALVESFPAPIAVVQHMVPGFVHSLVEWLDGVTPLTVRVAADGAELRPGHVYVAPDNRHLVLRSRTALSVVAGAPVAGSLPSGDRLLQSIAEHCGPAGAALVLSGMGNDGRDGAAAVRAAGGTTLAQDEQTSVVFGMARAAWEAGAIARLVPLDEIAAALVSLATPLRARTGRTR